MPIEDVDFLHPAHMIQEEMQTRGWELWQLVYRMLPEESWSDSHEVGVTYLSMELYFAVRDTRVLMGDSIANGLSRSFGVAPIFFLRLHDSWRKKALAEEHRNG